MQHPIIGRETIQEVVQLIASSKLSGFRGTPEGHDGGEYVQKLEAYARVYFGVKHAIAIQSATAGLHAAMIACGVKEGDEVIVTPSSFSSSVSCVKMVGATPVFVDITDDTFCMRPALVEKAITNKTVAIIPVDLMGHSAEMNTIMAIARGYGLMVVEDAAQSIGGKWKGKFQGIWGDIGIFSFNQSKQISTGEGGMVVTDDEKLAHSLRAVRNHGEVSDPEWGMVGYNYRLNEIEALLALRQFEDLENMLSWRHRLAGYMTAGLRQFDFLTPPTLHPDCRHAWYTYGVKFDEVKAGMTRADFLERLAKRGISFGRELGYCKPLYRLPAYGGRENLCPVAERLWAKEWCVFDWLRFPVTTDEVDECVEAIKEIVLLHDIRH